MQRSFVKVGETIAMEENNPEVLGGAAPFVFLGGTINGSAWREKLIPQLTVPFFNPVEADWSPEDAQRENQAKAAAEVLLFCITPKQSGIYSIVEMTLAVTAQRTKKLIIAFLNEDDGVAFTDAQIASNNAAKELLLGYPDVEVCDSLEQVASFLNTHLQGKGTSDDAGSGETNNNGGTEPNSTTE